MPQSARLGAWSRPRSTPPAVQGIFGLIVAVIGGDMIYEQLPVFWQLFGGLLVIAGLLLLGTAVRQLRRRKALRP